MLQEYAAQVGMGAEELRRLLYDSAPLHVSHRPPRVDHIDRQLYVLAPRLALPVASACPRFDTARALEHNVEPFPKHFHDGDEITVVESHISDDPEEAI